jgi:hypothetical protein
MGSSCSGASRGAKRQSKPRRAEAGLPVDEGAGQHTGSKRLKSASLNHAESSRDRPAKPHE